MLLIELKEWCKCEKRWPS